MTDALGWRRKFAVIAPSTNTIVEPDFYSMTVPGVTAHFSRIHIRNQNLAAINTAIWWMALRDNGIEGKVYGAGRLLREY